MKKQTIASIILSAVLFSTTLGVLSHGKPLQPTAANTAQFTLQPVNADTDYDNEDFVDEEEETPASTKTNNTKIYLSSPYPLYDIAVKAGKKVTLAVYGPSGAKVKVSVNGKTYTLKESKKNKGYYSGSYAIPNIKGTNSLGQIVYEGVYKGQTNRVKSEGRLFAVGKNSTLVVQMDNISATAFKDPRTRDNGYITTLKKGAIDTVTDYYGNMYRLANSGWVDASACTPLEKKVAVENRVNDVDFREEAEGEYLVLYGTSHPTYKAKRDNNTLSLTFANTSGISSLPIEQSRIFSNASVTEDGANTTITFTQVEPGALWGYLVEYESGATIIVFKPRPEVASGEQPLSGITVVVDAGHGGKDQGAAGLASSTGGLVEKEITLAAAKELQKQLEAKGATVIMTRTGDETVSLSERLAAAHYSRADFMISLHCNSAAASTGNGVEVFYYDAISKRFAGNISERVAAATERTNRGGKYSCYVVTLNSHAPSVLVEMGFMTNAQEYKGLQDSDKMKATAKAITQSVVDELSR